MTGGEFPRRLADFWRDFRRERSGLLGLGILISAFLLAVFEPLVLPYKEAGRSWRNISYWQDSPRAAPPAWTNWLSRKKSAVTSRLEAPEITEEFVKDENFPAGAAMRVYSFRYEYGYDLSPADLILRFLADGGISAFIDILRPDGEIIPAGRITETGLSGTEVRFSLENDGRSGVTRFLRSRSGDLGIYPSGAAGVRPLPVVFSVLEPEMLRAGRPLKGTYTVRLKIPSEILASPGAAVRSVRLLVAGRVSGILGTDTAKRDLFSGVVAGLKWALLIGIVTSFISVLIGVMYGIVSAYLGGFVDTVMSFLWEIFVSVPVLPVLIVMSAVFKPSLWIIIGALIVFSWVGPVKTVRSMALQIKEEVYIEAAKALGAGKGRIIFKHMAPLLLPYSFANMALSVPAVIVFEASLSLIGLGDPTIVTWGQILHDAQSSGAVLNGLWWWVVPPGLLIALTGMTFAFLGFAMDKILHPKLRTR